MVNDDQIILTNSWLTASRTYKGAVMSGFGYQSDEAARVGYVSKIS